MKKYAKILFISTVLIIAPWFTQAVIAQPPPPKPKDIPIDGGLSVLLLAGIAYGGKRLYSLNASK